eukprot:1629631-Prymnesium_polylepis.1
MRAPASPRPPPLAMPPNWDGSRTTPHQHAMPPLDPDYASNLSRRIRRPWPSSIGASLCYWRLYM